MVEKEIITKGLIVGIILTMIGILGFNKGRNYDYGIGPQGLFVLIILIAVALFGTYMIIDSFYKLVKTRMENLNRKP